MELIVASRRWNRSLFQKSPIRFSVGTGIAMHAADFSVRRAAAIYLDQ
jgi:hypothetical protein